MSEMNALAGVVLTWLVVASITAAVLTPLAWIACRTFGRQRAAIRHEIWLHVLLAVVILPALWLLAPKVFLPVLPAMETPVAELSEPAATNPAATTVSGSVSFVPEPKANAANATFPRGSVSWITWVVVSWLTGMSLMLARLLVAGMRLRRIRKHARHVDVGGYSFPILVSDQIEGPVCCGALRPAVLLPRALFEEEDKCGFGMILAHESAHVRRKDCVTNLFQRLVEAVFFFHPCVWYASRELTRERELICDQHVIYAGSSDTDYVKLLSNMVERGWGSPSPESVALFEGSLLMRVRTILGSQNIAFPELSRRARVLSAVVVSILLLAVGSLRLVARAAQSPEETQATEEAKQAKEDMRAITLAIREFSQRHGSFPKTLDEFRAEAGRPNQRSVGRRAGKSVGDSRKRRIFSYQRSYRSRLQLERTH
jgi:beta-lactamase regulating signal transducer with metallopeptidase domain